MINKNIAFIGAGFMGSALMRGLVQSKAVKPEQITATDPRSEVLKTLADELGVKTADDNVTAVKSADIVVFAVKPQILEDVMAGARGGGLDGKLIISVAAGVKVSSLVSWSTPDARVIRAMPNMGAAVGEAATAICGGGKSNDNDIELAQAIFESVGTSVVVTEELMDTVTALSGSGPAYIFMFLDAMIDAGVQCGLTKEAAQALATQTLYGSALLALKSDESPASLKKSISSPGGTTVAGLAVLEEAGFAEAVAKAIEAAMKRSKELGA